MFKFLRNWRSKRKMEKKGFIGSRKLQKPEETFSHAVERSRFLAVTILMLVWLACVVILQLPKSQRSFLDLVPRQSAPYTVYSELDFSYEDAGVTKAKKAEAEEAVPLEFRVDEAVVEQRMNLARTVLKAAVERDREARKGQEYVPDQANPASVIVGELTPGQLEKIVLVIRDPRQKELLLDKIRVALCKGIISPSEKDSHIYGQRVYVTDHRDRRRGPKQLASMPTPSAAATSIATALAKNYSPVNKQAFKDAIADLCETILIGDLFYDVRRTEEARIEAAAAVPREMIELHKGDRLLRRGQLVEMTDIQRMETYEKKLAEAEGLRDFWRHLINSAVISLLLMAVTGIYIQHLHPEVIRSNQKMWLMGTVVIIGVLINYFAIEAFNAICSKLEEPPPPTVITLFIPVGLAAAVLSVLVGLRVAFYIGLFISIIAALQLGDAYRIIVDGFVVSCVVGFAVRHVPNHKSYFLRIIATVFVLLLILNYHQLWAFADNSSTATWIVAACFANGLLTAVLALIAIFLLEPVFQIRSDMSLLLLCDYNHPLLKRLQLEAPGTYHHSLMVATLAEQAAQAIGANHIKTRVCALFHDIGKLSHPEYFTENNMLGESKHDKLKPGMSRMVILNHVKEGVDMAIKHKLCKIIRDGIEQHHGTGLVSFFYQRAVDEQERDTVNATEGDFRYPGPLPVEREVVIVSLADTCEAASRSLEKPSPTKVQGLVEELFRRRIRDKQLDAADLTIAELAKIRESFVKMIPTMLHGRVAYPKEEGNNEDEVDLFKPPTQVPEPPKKDSAAAD